MGVFCTSCGSALNEGAKFCTGCGASVFQSNESEQIMTETPVTAKSEQEVPTTVNSTMNGTINSTMNSTRNSTRTMPRKNQASNDAVQQSPMGAGKYIVTYIRQSIEIFKNPKEMLPTAILGLVWLVVALLGSLGINSLPVRILSFLTFAQGGMFGGVFGAVGGIIGKIVVAAFLNAFIMPLFQKKAPFSGIGGGIKGFFGGLAVDSIKAVSPLLGGLGTSLILYAFMNSNQSLQNSMVGIIASVMLFQNLGRQGGFVWGLAFSAANTLSKGRTPSYISVKRCISGMTLGFALGVALSAAKLRWSAWLGLLLLIVALIFRRVSKSKKEVTVA